MRFPTILFWKKPIAKDVSDAELASKIELSVGTELPVHLREGIDDSDYQQVRRRISSAQSRADLESILMLRGNWY